MRLTVLVALTLLGCALAGPLTPGVWYNDTAQSSEYRHYTVEVPDWSYAELQITMIVYNGDPDLYVKYDQPANQSNYDIADTTTAKFYYISLRTAEGSPRLRPGTWHLAVYAFPNPKPAHYSIRADLFHCPGDCSGHGTCNRDTQRCICDEGYQTDKIDCSAQIVKLKLGQSYEGVVPVLSKFYAEFDLDIENAIDLQARIERIDSPKAIAAYLKRGIYPSAIDWDAAAFDMGGSPVIRVRLLDKDKLRTGKWYLAIDNEKEYDQPFRFRLTVHAFACQNGCSGHGKCDEQRHVCECDLLWIGTPDCSVSVIPLSAGSLHVVHIPAAEKRAFHVNVPADAQKSGSMMVVKVTTHHQPGEEIHYPRVYVNPLTVPTVDSYWAANPLPQVTSTSTLRVSREDLLEQGTKWFLQVDNSQYQHRINATVLVSFDAYCAHGQSNPHGVCICDDGWTGVNCEESNRKTVSPGGAAGIALLTMAFGLVGGFVLARACPGWCRLKEDAGAHYNHLDR